MKNFPFNTNFYVLQLCYFVALFMFYKYPSLFFFFFSFPFVFSFFFSVIFLTKADACLCINTESGKSKEIGETITKRQIKSHILPTPPHFSFPSLHIFYPSTVTGVKNNLFSVLIKHIFYSTCFYYFAVFVTFTLTIAAFTFQCP